MKIIQWLFVDHVSDVIVPLASTFLTSILAKARYTRNAPLDKLEIAYNRVYFPIWMLIKKTEKPDLTFVEKCKIYLYKYRKYIDESTLIALNNLEQCINAGNEKKIKRYYCSFKNEIYRNNNCLRRYLGYLDSGLWTLYNVESSQNKRILRMGIEGCAFYSCIIISFYLQNEKYKRDLLIVILVIIVIVVFELLGALCTYIINKINKRTVS